MSTVPANYDDFEARDMEARNVELTTEVVAAYVAHNALTMSELPMLIESVHAAIAGLGTTKKVEKAAEQRIPAVPVKKSITDDYIVSLFDGRKFKSLKRHLMAEHNMSPDEYRTAFGLPKDYPMVAPNYGAARSELAKKIGLGRKPYARAA